MRKDKACAPGMRQRNAVNGGERCWLRSAAGTLAAIAAVGCHRRRRRWREVGEDKTRAVGGMVFTAPL